MGDIWVTSWLLQNAWKIEDILINIHRTNSGRFWEQGNLAWGILPTFMEFWHKPNSTEHFYLH